MAPLHCVGLRVRVDATRPGTTWRVGPQVKRIILISSWALVVACFCGWSFGDDVHPDSLCWYYDGNHCVNLCGEEIYNHRCYPPPMTSPIPGFCVEDSDPAPGGSCVQFIRDCGRSRDRDTGQDFGDCFDKIWCDNL